MLQTTPPKGKCKTDLDARFHLQPWGMSYESEDGRYYALRGSPTGQQFSVTVHLPSGESVHGYLDGLDEEEEREVFSYLELDDKETAAQVAEELAEIHLAREEEVERYRRSPIHETDPLAEALQEASETLNPDKNVRDLHTRKRESPCMKISDIRTVRERYRDALKRRGDVHKCKCGTHLMSPASRPDAVASFLRPDNSFDCERCGPQRRAELHLALLRELSGREVFMVDLMAQAFPSWDRKCRRHGGERVAALSSAHGMTILHTAASLGGEPVEDLEEAIFEILSSVRSQSRKGEQLVRTSRSLQKRLKGEPEGKSKEKWTTRGWGQLEPEEVFKEAERREEIKIEETEEHGILILKPEGWSWRYFLSEIGCEYWPDVLKRRKAARERAKAKREIEEAVRRARRTG